MEIPRHYNNSFAKNYRNATTKYYINENIEKYSIKIPKSRTRKRLEEFNHKKRQRRSFEKNTTIK
jgi:hypothetical protein